MQSQPKSKRLRLIKGIVDRECDSCHKTIKAGEYYWRQRLDHRYIVTHEFPCTTNKDRTINVTTNKF